MNVLGIAGSLRAGSYNRMLLRAAIELAPPGMTIATHEIGEIPLYNQDVEADGTPESVVAFKSAIAAADCLVIATPEYNFGVPGVLKNAIDWASRPPRQSPLGGKPVGIFGASMGMVGTARAQLQLRQNLIFTASLTMPTPEVLVGRAQEKFDAEGMLKDEATREFVGKFLVALEAWTLRFSETR